MNGVEMVAVQQIQAARTACLAAMNAARAAMECCDAALALTLGVTTEDQQETSFDSPAPSPTGVRNGRRQKQGRGA